MFHQRTSIGLDVHARTIVAAAIDEQTGQMWRSKMRADYQQVRAWIASLPEPVMVTYEAGPTGYGLYRTLVAAGINCQVAAPSKLQRPAGDRVKTDPRDAAHLAQLTVLDQITPVAVPTPAQEAARDLVRARDDARADLMRARHRLSKLLLRHDVVYAGTHAWTGAHDRWLRGPARQAIDYHAIRATFDADYENMCATRDRRDRLDQQIATIAATSDYTPIVARLGCLRGIGTLTGFALAVEIGDWQRFTGRSIAAYMGLTPAEYSSGGRRNLGPITKTGNSHARRLLVEAAWHHRSHYRPGPSLRERWNQAPSPARVRGHQGNQRLHQRWLNHVNHHKRANVANIAIARELAGWCWSLATLED